MSVCLFVSSSLFSALLLSTSFWPIENYVFRFVDPRLVNLPNLPVVNRIRNGDLLKYYRIRPRQLLPNWHVDWKQAPWPGEDLIVHSKRTDWRSKCELSWVCPCPPPRPRVLKFPPTSLRVRFIPPAPAPPPVMVFAPSAGKAGIL